MELASRPWAFDFRRTLPLRAIVVVSLAAGFVAGAIPPPEPAQAGGATAECSEGTLEPASRAVRRNGRVLLTGRVCGVGSTSASSSEPTVRLKIRRKRGWASLGSHTTDADGGYSVCTRIPAPKRSKRVRLRAIGPGGDTAGTALRIADKAGRGCSSGPVDDAEAVSEQGNPNCPLSQPGSTIALTLPSACTQVASDTAASADPTGFWGRIECQTSSRHQQIPSGGDPHSTGAGTSQGNDSFRRLTAIDGDNFYGERCELGHNNQGAPTAVYREGQRRVTFASIRLPASSPIDNPNWRNVLQMKQAQPYHNPNPASIFELQVRAGEWHVNSNWNGVWSTPAQQNQWTRFAFDIVYSQNPAVGSIKVYVDLNGDGDAADANEQSPVNHLPTLRVETAGGSSPIAPGESIPSHLRAGIYQNPNYSCPTGCSVDIDNVQVFKP